MSPPRLSAAAIWIFVGIFVLQLGWMFAVRPFAGIDEYDHAYRAASVARGHWAPELKQSDLGRGDLILVPSDIVSAAAVPCMDLPYTSLLNCHAASWPNQNGEVLVASAAARYNPLYYALAGTPAVPFEGASALYVMRLATIVLCDLLLFPAVLIALRMARSLWPAATLLTAATPVMLYATANTAPNGVHLSAGLLMWTSVLALTRSRDERTDRWLLVALTMAVVIVLTLHTTGPMWVLLTMGSVALLRQCRAKMISLWQTGRGLLLSSSVLMLIIGLLDLLWIVTRRTNLSGDDGEFGGPAASDLLISMPLWVFQTVGSVPFRNEYAPTAVFGISLVMFFLLWGIALVKSTRAEKSVFAVIVALFFVVPTALTYATHDALGVAWQGRYALPYACGLLLLAGWVLDRSAPQFRFAPPLIGVSAVAFGLAQSIAIVNLVHRQRPTWPGGFDPSISPPWMTTLTCALASVAICVGIAIAAKCSRRPLADSKQPAPQRQLVNR